MARWEALQINLNTQEREVLEAAARRAGMKIEVYIKTAALSASRDVPAKRSGHELVWIHREAADRGQVWTEEELREKNLPLYWCEAWVRARLAEGHTVIQIAGLCGAPKSTVRYYLSTHYDIDTGRRKLTPEQIEEIRRRVKNGESRTEVARDFRMSQAGIGRYVRDQPTYYETDSLRAIQRTQPQFDPLPVERAQPWPLRLLQRQLAAVTPWPATVAQIAAQLFDDNRGVARGWAQRHYTQGVLIRLKPGLYDINPQREPSPDVGEG